MGRIVSLNAWGGALYDRLASWLPNAGADVLCLQEVTRTSGVRGWTSFADGERTLPQRADLFADVSDILPRHHAEFAASDRGPVLDHTGRRHRQEFGLATWVAESVDYLSATTGFVHREVLEHEEWPNGDRPRAVLAIRLRDGGRAISVVQLHGLRDPAGKGDTPARKRQAERLAAFVQRIRETDDLCVLCGDLNLLPTSETFTLLSEIGLDDLVGGSDTRTSRYAKPIRHASYLLVSDLNAVSNFEVLRDPEVSDHRALLLEV